MKHPDNQALQEPREEPPCPLCRSGTIFFLHQLQREYRQCPDCRLIFVPSRYFLSPEEEKERYLEHENMLDNTGYVNMFLEKIKIVQSVCRGVHKVLDYGCGYEPVLQTLLTREGYAAEGYDSFFFPQGNLEPGYDLIISTETFEHFRQPGSEIGKLVALLPPAGFLAVMTRFHCGGDNPEASRENFRNWYYQRDPTHIAFYSPHTFAWIAKDQGLEIVYNNETDFIILQRPAG
ncbi:MAG: class I SAM-dependent methyltransferase [Nitrospinota bacterium]|nr:class I SAM-dependent methyltransferase [Nitrospinota bacterium]